MNKTLPNLSYNGVVNVIDLEALTKGRKEIAEIGITLVSLKERKILNSYSVYVRPDRLEEDYDWFFQKLTGIKKSTLYKASPLKEVLNMLSTSINFIKRPLICWGEDHIALSQELWSKRCPKLQPMHIVNLQLHYAFSKGITENIALKQALKDYNLDFEGTAHSGQTDSYNTARLFLEILK